MDPPSILPPALKIQPLTSYQGQQQEQRSAFARGQILQALVAGRAGNNQFTLNIGNSQLLAQSTANLQIGQKLDLQVTNLSPKVTLQIVNDPLIQGIGKSIHLLDHQPKLLANISTLNSNAASLQPLSSAAQQTLNLFSSLANLHNQPPAAADTSLQAATSLRISGQDVQQLAEHLGLNLEQLLANGNKEQAVQTLKYALLELSQLQGSSGKVPEQTSSPLQTIELFQMLQLRLANEALFFLPLPFSFLEQGFLLIEDQKSGAEKEGDRTGKGTTYGLHLQLKGLGSMQIDINQDGDKVGLKFILEDAERAKFMAAHREELTDWLTRGELTSARFLTGAEEPVKKLLTTMVHGATGMLDTKA